MVAYEDCLACSGTGFVIVHGEERGCPRCFGRGLREVHA